MLIIHFLMKAVLETNVALHFSKNVRPAKKDAGQ